MALKEITAQDWVYAFENYGALRELIEARYSQTIFVEAVLLDVPNEPDHIFIAVSDMAGHYDDFSVFQDIIRKRDINKYQTRYYKTNNMQDVKDLISKIQDEQFSDDSI